MRRLLITILLAGLPATGYTETLSGVCMVSVTQSSSHRTDTADVLLRDSSCAEEGGHCGTSEHSDIAWTRWSGISPQTLQQEGTQLVGEMKGEAGTLLCSGAVHDGVLAGRYRFTPDPAFVEKMAPMGFHEITPRKQEGFLMLDITTAWVQQMKGAGVTDLSTDKLMGLRALQVDSDYVRGMAAAGYPELRAGKLTEMKAVGVTPEKAREARALGFQPTEEELVQMSIFKIDRPFIEKMRSRGLKDLTLAKLIKIKIFRLED